MAAVGQGIQGFRRQQDRQTQVAHGQLDRPAQRQDSEDGGHQRTIRGGLRTDAVRPSSLAGGVQRAAQSLIYKV